MLKAFKKITISLLWLLAIIIIVLAIGLNVMRFTLPYWHAPRQYLQTWASNTLHLPIKIAKVDAYWRGMHPVIEFANVQLLGKNKKRILAHIHYLQIKLDLWESVLHGNILPENIIINGSHFSAYQNKSGRLFISGVSNVGAKVAGDSSASDHDAEVQDIAAWLLSQVNLTVRGVDFKISLYNHKTLYINNLNLDANRNRANQIQGHMQLIQPQLSKLSFVYRPHTSRQAGKFSGKLYLKVNNFHAQSWAPLLIAYNPSFLKNYALQQATWDGALWASWGQQSQSLQLVGSFSDLSFRRYVDKKVFNIKKISGNVYWQKAQGSWNLTAGDLDFAAAKVNLKGVTAALQYNSQPQSIYSMQLEKFNFKRLQELYDSSIRSLLPGKFWREQQNFKPQGVIKQLSIVWHKDALNNNSNNISINKTPNLLDKKSSRLNIKPAQEKHKAYNFLQHIEKVSIQADGLGWQQYKNIPGMQGLTGDVTYTPGHAHILIASAYGTSLYADKIFKHPVPIDSLSGQFDWRKNNKQWNLQWQKLKLTSMGVSMSGAGGVSSKAAADPVVQTKVNFSVNNIATLHQFMPQKLLHLKLRNWLNRAFVSGNISQGVLQWHGSLHEFPRHNTKNNYFKVLFNLNNADFHYGSEWPDVNDLQAQVAFNGAAMQVTTKKAIISGASIKSLQANIADLSRTGLIISGDVAGTLQQGRGFIINSPLSFADGLKPLQLQGPLKLHLDLNVPLHDKNTNVMVNGGFSTVGAKVSLPKWNLFASNVTGDFDIKNNKLFAKSIPAQLLGHEAIIKISTQESVLRAAPGKNNANMVKSKNIVVNINGYANAAKSLQGRNLFFAPYLKGDFPYQANMILYPKNNWRRSVLTITSNSKGLAIKMPPPFAKAAAKNLSIKSIFVLAKNNNKPSVLKVYAGRKWSVALNLLSQQKGIKIERGSVRINSPNADLPDHPGLVVSGSLYNLDWDQWRNYIYPQQDAGNVTATNKKLLSGGKKPEFSAPAVNFPVRLVSLQVGRLHYSNYIFKNVGFKLWFLTSGYRLHMDTDKINGFVNIPHNYPKGLVTFKLSRLRLPFSTAVAAKKPLSPVAAATEKSSDWLSDPNVLPALRGEILDFNFKKHNFGKTNIDIEHVDHGLRIAKLDTTAENFSLHLTGDWLKNQDRSNTHLQGYLYTANAGATAREWDVINTIADGRGNIKFDLKWPAPVLPPVLSKASGTLSINIDGGRIVDLDKDTQSKMGIGKLLNLLSLQTLPRRLSLDFSDLTKKGYSFDSMKGNFKFINGLAKVSDGSIDGPVANVKLNGSIDFAKSYYDITADVRPHLTSSLPLIATIAGTPIAGVITWVLNKAVVSPIVGRIARKVIHMRGYLDRVDQPKVTVKAYKDSKPVSK